MFEGTVYYGKGRPDNRKVREAVGHSASIVRELRDEYDFSMLFLFIQSGTHIQ